MVLFVSAETDRQTDGQRDILSVTHRFDVSVYEMSCVQCVGPL